MTAFVLIHDWCDDLTLYPFSVQDGFPNPCLFHCKATDEPVSHQLTKLVEYFDIDYEPEKGESLTIEPLSDLPDLTEVLS